MGTVSPGLYCSPFTSQRQSDSRTHTPSWKYRPSTIWLLLLYVYVCVFVTPPTCWTVPCGHWQPGVQFLLRSIVRSVHETAPLTHCLHSWPGGHTLPSPDTATEPKQRLVKTLSIIKDKNLYLYLYLDFIKNWTSNVVQCWYNRISLIHQNNTYFG